MVRIISAPLALLIARTANATPASARETTYRNSNAKRSFADSLFTGMTF